MLEGIRDGKAFASRITDGEASASRITDGAGGAPTQEASLDDQA